MLDLLKKYKTMPVKTVSPRQREQRVITREVEMLCLPRTRVEGGFHCNINTDTLVAKLDSSFFHFFRIHTEDGKTHAGIATIPAGYVIGYGGLRTLLRTYKSYPSQFEAITKLVKIYAMQPEGIDEIKNTLKGFSVELLAYEPAATSKELTRPRYLLTKFNRRVDCPRELVLISHNCPRDEIFNTKGFTLNITPPRLDLEYMSARWKVLEDGDTLPPHRRRAVHLEESTVTAAFQINGYTAGGDVVLFGLRKQIDTLQFTQFVLELNQSGHGLNKYFEDGELLTPEDVFVYSDREDIRKEICSKFGFTEGTLTYRNSLQEALDDNASKFVVVSRAPQLGLLPVNVIYIYTNFKGSTDERRCSSAGK